MLKNIFYFVDARGQNSVKAFIDSLPIKEQAKIFAYVMELKQQGHNLKRPLSGYLGSGIYELRPQRNRIFYFFFLKNNAVLVHAVKKQSRTIPKRDLELCIKRKKETENFRNIEK